MQPPRTHTGVGTSKPARCQTPVYAVVDKTRKKVNTQPAHIAERADDREKTRKDNPKGDNDNDRHTNENFFFKLLDYVWTAMCVL